MCGCPPRAACCLAPDERGGRKGEEGGGAVNRVQEDGVEREVGVTGSPPELLLPLESSHGRKLHLHRS